MDTGNIIRNIQCFPNTHFFVYRNKKYPIKYDFFKYSSNYFQNHQEIAMNENIPLLDENSEKVHDFSDDIINNFIDFVQCVDVKLTHENVVGLNYLSNKYEVLTLKKHTEEYIKRNHKNVAVEILLQSEKEDGIDYKSFEDIISANFEDYIQDERLQLLDLPTLYRILSQYRMSKSSQKTCKEVVDFVFKVLQKNGRKASILFTQIDFGDSRSEIVNRLLTEFSEKFDFHFIGRSLVSTLYETQNRLLMRDEEHKKEIDELKRTFRNEIERIEKKNKEETKKLIDGLRAEMNEEVKKITEEMEKNKKSSDERIEEQIGKSSVKMDAIEVELKAIKDEVKNVNEEVKQVEILTKKLHQVELLYNQNAEFNGIIKYLTDKTGGNIHDNKTIEVTSNSICGSYHPKYLLDFTKDRCYEADSKNDSWICFDFKNMKVKITNYSIKSYNSNYHHLKSWIFEVSDNGENWITIDEHKDCQTLNSSYVTGTFGVRPNDFSRYVRLHQTDTPWGGHDLWFYYLELYGYLQK